MEWRDRMKLFDNKIIIVTGAAGGMGKAIVQELLNEDATVIALDLSTKNLDDIQHERLLTYETNVLAEENIQKIVSEVYENYGKIDGLVNALGIAQAATPVEEVTLEEWDRLLNVNVKSLFITSRAVVPFMKQQKKGSIITIASISAVRPRPGLQTYIASKGAAESFTRGLAIELAEHGIRVNTIHPGPADTTMLGKFTSNGGDIEQTKEEIFRKSVPLGRLIVPQDIANAVSFLLSDKAEIITGSTLHVDGGRGL